MRSQSVRGVMLALCGLIVAALLVAEREVHGVAPVWQFGKMERRP